MFGVARENGIDMELSEMVSRLYDEEAVSFHPLHSDSGKRIYRVKRAVGQQWVLRMYPSVNDDDAIFSLADLLLFFEQKSYAAERVVRTVEGSVVATYSGWRLVMTTFIEGVIIDYSPATLRLLGAAIGRLHALSLQDALHMSLSIPLAEMRPINEIKYALEQLRSVASKVPANLQERYNTLIAALHDIDLCVDLPAVIIHNDCHPGNSVHTTHEGVVMIDWDGGGIGPAVLDVGFLLSSCDAKAPWDPLITDGVHPDEESIKAIVDGYCQHHLLTSRELDRLADAIRFRAIVYGACHFAQAVVSGERADEFQWWWARYNAAEEIAISARKQFGM